jgi:anti-sigma factor RsiW
MICENTTVLLHALIDGELDAGHAREVEVHTVGCRSCGAQLRDYRMMHQAMTAPALGYRAPESLRRRFTGVLPTATLPAPRRTVGSRRSMLTGFGMGSFVSTALAACLLLFVMHNEEDQRIVGDAVSAHLRSLQSHHLIDVQSTDQHTVKPWFNGRIDMAPPVIDLKAQGFTLVGGRLDYLDGRPVAAIVYQRRDHVINLFVSPATGSERGATIEKLQGFNVWRWSWSDLGFWAVSDIDAGDLQEFGKRFETAVQAGGS